MPEAGNKVWHGHPVWFLDGNPVAGYSREKPGIRLMFWSGADFGEAGLNVLGKKFKDASVFYNAAAEVRDADLKRWLEKARVIQWDYKNIVKRKGLLERVAATSPWPAMAVRGKHAAAPGFIVAVQATICAQTAGAPGTKCPLAGCPRSRCARLDFQL